MIRRNLICVLSLLVLMGSAACSKVKNNSDSEFKTLRLNIALGSYSTRAIDLPYDDGDDVALNITNVKVYAYDKETGGEVISEHTATFTKGAEGTEKTDYTAKIVVPSRTERVMVEFNSDALVVSGVGTLGSNINTRQGGSDATVVKVSGESLVSEDNTVSITAYAEMARLQIVDDIATPTATGATNYKNLTIQAIYINNTKIERDGANVLTTDGEIDVDYTTDGTKSKLFENLTKCVVTGDDATYSMTNMENTHFFTRTAVSSLYPKVELTGGALRGEAVGFNLFPQGDGVETDVKVAEANLPFVILKIGFTEKMIGSTWTHVDVINGKAGDDLNANNNFVYMKVIAFDSATNTFPPYVGGKVYEFSMSDLMEQILAPVGPEELIIKLNVTITDWIKRNHDLIPMPEPSN